MMSAPARPAYPKPEPRQREPKLLKRTAALKPKRWGVSRSTRGTKHGRRERDFARMAFLSSTDACAVRAWMLAGSALAKRAWFLLHFPDCDGRIEVAHLSLGKTAGRRRAPDRQTSPICHQHHTDIDGKIGGQGRWYAGLGYDGQQELRRWLIDWATDKWDALTPGERAYWERRAAEDHAHADGQEG